MLVSCYCPACQATYEEIALSEGDATSVPPCPRCGSWRLRLRVPGPVAAASEILSAPERHAGADEAR